MDFLWVLAGLLGVEALFWRYHLTYWIIFWTIFILWFAVMELVAKLKTGRSLSQQMWDRIRGQPKRIWIVRAALIIFWAIVVLHLTGCDMYFAPPGGGGLRMPKVIYGEGRMSVLSLTKEACLDSRLWHGQGYRLSPEGPGDTRWERGDCFAISESPGVFCCPK
jgi:hypothetical protein